MNQSKPGQTGEARGPKPHQLLFLRFTAGVACLCLSAALFLPVLTGTTWSHRVPKGQLRADIKTLVATVHYLFEAEPNVESNPTRLIVASLTLAPHTNSLPLDPSAAAGLSNQATAFGYSSNLPAQS